MVFLHLLLLLPAGLSRYEADQAAAAAAEDFEAAAALEGRLAALAGGRLELQVGRLWRKDGDED